MARTTGTRSLADLIQQGTLKAGDRLVINRRSAPPLEATLQRDGTIQYKGTSYSAPSTAAKAALDVGSVDGWLRWRVLRLDGRSLADLRENS